MKRVNNAYEYIRHPEELPIHCHQAANDAIHPQRRLAATASHCGLRFRSDQAYAPGTAVDVDIPVNDQAIHVQGHVIWSQRRRDAYEIAICFDSDDDAFMARMAEQVCHIEEYRRRIHADEGRRLSVETAAEEWIDKYARLFPRDLEDD